MRLQHSVTLILHTVRVFLYTTSSFVKQCRLTLLRIMVLSGMQGLLTSISRSPRLLLLILVILALLLYMWPSWLRLSYSHIAITPMDTCLSAKLQSVRQPINDFDVVTMPNEHTGLRFLPFVGNGYIGAVADGQSRLYIKYGRYLSMPVNFHPIIMVRMSGLPERGKTVLDLVQGTASNLQCLELEGDCVSVDAQVFAHRKYPSLLIQHFNIYNPTDQPVTAELVQIGTLQWEGSETETRRTAVQQTPDGEDIHYSLTTGIVKIPERNGTEQMVVAISAARLPETITIQPGSKWRYHSITSVKYEVILQAEVSSRMASLKQLSEQELLNALGREPHSLQGSHVKVWKSLWSSGFGISYSRAAGAPNGDRINTTMYYVMSHLSAPMHEDTVTPSVKQELAKLLYFPDRCYGGHHTLQNARMWRNADNMDDLLTIVNTWIITLEKQGCSAMLKAGADGALQALMLSIGGFQFGNDHLEMGMHPSDLHRDFFFRRLNYGNNTHLNISIRVGEDNKAQIFTALDRNDRPYYACDAGCIDPPVKLSNEWNYFPVKLTDPVTAILYITSDRQHMMELKHAIHLRNIIEAPAHEHHILALHRHGHHYGGLPLLFWAAISFLIIIFHLFLFKLIFNEYCNASDGRYNFPRTRYQV